MDHSGRAASDNVTIIDHRLALGIGTRWAETPTEVVLQAISGNESDQGGFGIVDSPCDRFRLTGSVAIVRGKIGMSWSRRDMALG